MAHVLLLASLADSLLLFRGDLIKAMQQHGHTITASAPPCDAALQERLKAANICFIPIPMQRTGMNPLADAQTLLALLRLMQTKKPDCVMAYTIKPVIYGMTAARLLCIKRRFALITGLGFAFTESGGGYKRSLVRLLLSRLYRIALKNAKGVIFQNPDDRTFFETSRLISPSQPRHIVNGSGVNIDHFFPTPLPKEPVFLMIARLLRDKGAREYVKAARKVKASNPDTRFLLVGPMDSNPSAISKNEVESWAREGAIEYLGSVSDIRPVLSQASAYVLPSYREGTPRTVLEAMAMARPIITTDAPGCRETVVEGKNGLLVPPRDASSLAKAMQTLAASEPLRTTMGKTSRLMVEEKYDVKKVNAEMLRIMDLS